MKQTRTYSVVSCVALLAALTGCGGGGDAQAGAPTALSVQPNVVTVTANAAANGGPPKGQCAAGFASRIYIYGGAAPYRLDNTAPDAVTLSAQSIADPGGSFDVTFTGGGCISPAIVVVVDKLNNQVVLTLNNQPSPT